jgi:hypothetical protein
VRATASGRTRWILGAGALLLLAAIAAITRLGGEESAAQVPASASPQIVAGTPGGFVLSDGSSSPSIEPVADAPSPRPTPQPPTATPVPAASPVATPAATPAVAAVAGPDDTVGGFYGHVTAGRFDQAYALWSDRMKAAYPRQANLDERFSETADITFSTLYVASQTADTATVQANFTETYDSGATRSFIGYWQLVRVDGRWLLDRPTY